MRFETSGMNTTNIRTDFTGTRHPEGTLAKAIEQQTSKLPSDTFLWLAVASIGLSLGLRLSGRRDQSLFVGHWAPTILLLGLYNKLVKLFGSEAQD
jgi:hypothetical protein